MTGYDMKSIFSYSLLLVMLLAGCQNGSDNTPGSSSSSASSSSSSSLSSSSSSSGGTSPGCDFQSTAKPVEQRPLLVIRVNYSDIAFRNGAASWHDKIFGNDEHQLNHYYKTISQNRFSFVQAEETDGAADGIVTVSLSKPHPDYDINSASDISNVFQPDLASALEKSDTYVDYSMYDKDSNGAITADELLIVFILAGNEDAFSGNNDSHGVWAHQSCLYSSAITPKPDGVSVMGCAKNGNYAVFGERHIDPSIDYDEDASIGIIAHELGHAALGLPDLYDTSGASAGIGYFGLMASGMWGQKDAHDLIGATPVSMSAWSRLHNGWFVPQTVSTVSQQPRSLSDTASDDYAIIRLPIGEKQCFLIENRSTDGYDAGLNIIKGVYRGGLAIWHIDQGVIDAGQSTNTVNADASHKGVDLEEANAAGLDESFDYPGHAKNLFWRGNSTAFTADTSPSSRRYDGSDSGVAVTGISTPGPVMDLVITNPNQEKAQ